MWLHWTPREWRGAIPFEIGLYFFLALTGFLITRSLLRERDRGDSSAERWRSRAFKDFQTRRALRILIPCYVAMLFGLLVGAPDLRSHPLWYFTHLVNFHIAYLPEWPSGTSHYWTLAIQQQFYLCWPLLIFLAPRRWLGPLMIGIALIAPLSRFVLGQYFPEVIHPGAITSSALDYLAIGSLLALLLARGIAPTDRRIRLAAWICLPLYLILYVSDESGHSIPVLRHFQQTFLSISIVGLIAATLAGLPAPLGRVLNHSSLQHIGKISYGLYLFHTTVPLAIGFLLPFLWPPGSGNGMLVLRLLVFALSSWGIAWLSWRYLEQPLARIKPKAQH